eukprot:TRINITY_DN12950_c0_g1_i5.p1 TRINITY_DN12950_c0_g1~~TRINITY_DN12950_c0_g1_i5.p1  ORF type:complete len:427 (+),score=4.94 TRINITY_DN12950_c0_g1_i5:259-1539(+)
MQSNSSYASTHALSLPHYLNNRTLPDIGSISLCGLGSPLGLFPQMSSPFSRGAWIYGPRVIPDAPFLLAELARLEALRAVSQHALANYVVPSSNFFAHPVQSFILPGFTPMPTINLDQRLAGESRLVLNEQNPSVQQSFPLVPIKAPPERGRDAEEIKGRVTDAAKAAREETKQPATDDLPAAGQKNQRRKRHVASAGRSAILSAKRDQLRKGYKGDVREENKNIKQISKLRPQRNESKQEKNEDYISSHTFLRSTPRRTRKAQKSKRPHNKKKERSRCSGAAKTVYKNKHVETFRFRNAYKFILKNVHRYVNGDLTKIRSTLTSQGLPAANIQQDLEFVRELSAREAPALPIRQAREKNETLLYKSPSITFIFKEAIASMLEKLEDNEFSQILRKNKVIYKEACNRYMERANEILCVHLRNKNQN